MTEDLKKRLESLSVEEMKRQIMVNNDKEVIEFLHKMIDRRDRSSALVEYAEVDFDD